MRRPTSWARLRQMAEVVAQHGLIMAVDEIGLARYLPWRQRLKAKRWPPMDAGWPERVCSVLAHLGPTYVKLGQLASLRSDVLPGELVRALENLQDNVPAVDFKDITAIIERAWGGPPDRFVSWLDPVPLATASIGQVHRAKLFDGRWVVVKVRRPQVWEQAQADFRILRGLAARAEERVEWARQYGMKDLVEELVATMRDELDFVVEAQNTEAARRLFGQENGLRIPEVIWPLTRSEVLVLESIRGIKINDRPQLEAQGQDLKALSRQYIRALYQQIFLRGFFHADPHPGNVHVDSEGRLVFLDWGMVGHFTPEMRRRSVALVLGLARGDSAQVADALINLGSERTRFDRGALVRDIDRLRRRYYETTLQEFRLGQALSDIFQVARRYALRIPPEYLVLAKVAVIADGVVRELDPAFSLLEMGQSWVGELFWQQVNPAHWGPEWWKSSVEWADSVWSLPIEFERMLAKIQAGDIHIVLEHKNLDRMMSHWEVLVNRLALSMLLAAVVLGLALVAHRAQLNQMAGLPLGDYAVLLTVILAVWALVRAVRGPKKF
ncbi:MAG: AarF/UbiB family protein [Firmicutes bacterium]|nr:AarF/UbiB family protein [Bacillota bacterium]